MQLPIESSDENHFIALIFTRWSSLSASTQQDGRGGGFHLLRYKRRSIVDDCFALKCLAYESLRLAQLNAAPRPP